MRNGSRALSTRGTTLPSTPNRQNRNQVRWNTCAGVRLSNPSSKVVQTEQSRDLFQNKMAELCLHCTEIFFRLTRLVLIIIYIEKIWSLVKGIESTCTLSFFFLLGNRIVLFFYNSNSNRLIYSRVLQGIQLCLF